jgi:hypothetical protein
VALDRVLRASASRLKFTENGVRMAKARQVNNGGAEICSKVVKKVVKRRCACVPVLRVVHIRLKCTADERNGMEGKAE